MEGWRWVRLVRGGMEVGEVSEGRGGGVSKGRVEVVSPHQTASPQGEHTNTTRTLTISVLIVSTAQYMSCRSIQGFMQRTDAEKMLLQSPNGTFLIRFSEGDPGGISVAWVNGKWAGPTSHNHTSAGATSHN